MTSLFKFIIDEVILSQGFLINCTVAYHQRAMKMVSFV